MRVSPVPCLLSYIIFRTKYASHEPLISSNSSLTHIVLVVFSNMEGCPKAGIYLLVVEAKVGMFAQIPQCRYHVGINEFAVVFCLHMKVVPIRYAKPIVMRLPDKWTRLSLNLVNGLIRKSYVRTTNTGTSHVRQSGLRITTDLQLGLRLGISG